MATRQLLMVACALLATGVSSKEVLEIKKNIGEDLPISLETLFLPEDAFRCFLETPSKKTIQLRPKTEEVPSKYVLREYNTIVGCAVDVNITGPEDSGIWRLYFDRENIEEGLGNRVSTSVRVVVTDAVEEDAAFDVSQWINNKNNELVIKGQVVDGQALDYCRYVRVDGVGFSDDDLPVGYFSHSRLIAGICEIRIPAPTILDHHPWTITARVQGHTDDVTGNTTHTISMPIETLAAFDVSQWINNNNELVINGHVVDGYALDYCRYVRVDGVSFTDDDLPVGYFSHSRLIAGICEIRVPAPTVLDHHPWTIAARLQGHTVEFTGRTNHTISMPTDTLAVFDVSQWINNNNELVINGHVVDGYALDYCRYVRVDGVSFTDDDLPAGYFSHSRLVAGICEIRVPAPTVLDHHPWTIAARLQGHTVEFTGQTNHTISMPTETLAFDVSQWISNNNELVINGHVIDGYALDNCRYVRVDGVSFNDDNLPVGYFSHSRLIAGICEIRVPAPTTLDHHPWTIAARLRGHAFEFTGRTNHTISMPTETQKRGFQYVWILIIALSIATSLLGLSLATKRSRRWSARQATAIRNSFRIKKTPLPDTNTQVDNRTTHSYA